ncbi:MAG: YbhN family protein [Dongiaceae bacterium]
MRPRTLALFGLKLAISAAALIYVARQIDFDALWDHIPNPWSRHFLVAEFFYLTAFWISVYRWHLILKWQGDKVPLRPLAIIAWISNFFAMLLPGGLGRDISRGLYLTRFQIPALEIMRSILTDRFIGLATVIILSVPCMIFALSVPGPLVPLGWMLLALCAGLPLGLWLCHEIDRRYRGLDADFRSAWIARLIHAGAAILRDFRQPRLFGLPFLHSCLMMAATILCVMSIIDATGGQFSPLWSQPLLLPVIFLLSQLPISIAGIGVREAAFVSLFGAVGANAEQALSVSLAYFGLAVLNSLTGGIAYLMFRQRKTPPASA